MITKIRKRDGRLTDYDITKIENAIAKAMMSIGDGEIKDCKKMAKITELYIMEKFEDGIPTVEDIQDIVEAVLMKNGYDNVGSCPEALEFRSNSYKYGDYLGRFRAEVAKPGMAAVSKTAGFHPREFESLPRRFFFPEWKDHPWE